MSRDVHVFHMDLSFLHGVFLHVRRGLEFAVKKWAVFVRFQIVSLPCPPLFLSSFPSSFR